MKKWIWLLIFFLAIAAAVQAARVRKQPEADLRTEPEIIYEMIRAYEKGAAPGDGKIETLLDELTAIDPDSACRWTKIMDAWSESGSDMTIHPSVLPDGLEDTGALCISVLGFQLNPDGSMQEELIGRLQAAKDSAEKYPHAYILCTGGGTASASTVTEAETMAGWLIQNGIDKHRVLVESRSLTTTQNAMYCSALLREQCPEVTQAALVSSDYHLPWASILFQAQFILEEQDITLVSNAAYPTSTKLYGASLLRYQANGILEIASYH